MCGIFSRQNGKYIGNIFKYGQQITYSCDEGYEFNENSKSTYVCDETGIYQPVLNTTERRSNLPIYPTCQKVSCGPAINVSNALIFHANPAAEIFYQVKPSIFLV